MKSRLNSINHILLAVMISLACCPKPSQGVSRAAKTKIPFKGTASGGTLVLGYTDSAHSVYFVSIDTFAGESAESVVSRLAKAYVYFHSPNAVDKDARAALMTLGSTLEIMGGAQRFLAGTETGLGIPKPPLFLSCSYDKQADKLRLNWANPPGEYSENDYVKLKWHYNKYDGKGGGAGFLVPDIPTSYTIEKPVDLNDLDICIMVFRHEAPVNVLIANDIPLLQSATPSNLTAIHVTGNGYCQEDPYKIPFFAGIAPNWSAWSTASKVDKAAFEQGDKYNLGPHWHWDYPNPKTLLTKPFFQVIKAPPQDIVHGVYRKFLGLTPGHTYRLTACLTTLEMDSVQGDWSFSLHATHNGAERKDLTIQQLAGLAALPDGKRGPQAGRIAYYHRGKTTKANHEIVFSADKAASENEDASHIALPADVNTITVWLRFSCSDPKGKVGFSGIKLEDITASGSVKSPEQIMQEEHQEEARFLRGIKRMLRKESP